MRMRLNQLKLMLKTVIEFQMDINVHEGTWTKDKVIEYMTVRGFMTKAEAEFRWNQIVLNPGKRRHALHRLPGDPGHGEGLPQAQGRRLLGQGLPAEAGQPRRHPAPFAEDPAGSVRFPGGTRTSGTCPPFLLADELNKSAENGDTHRSGTCPSIPGPRTRPCRPPRRRSASSTPTPISTRPNSTPTGSAVVRRAFAAGIAAILCPADLTRAASLPAVAALQAEFPAVLAAAGVHAHQAKDFADGPPAGAPGAGRPRRASGRWARSASTTTTTSRPPSPSAKPSAGQLAFAGEAGLPVIVHSRLSGADVVAAVDAGAVRARRHPPLLHRGLGGRRGRPRTGLPRLVLRHPDLPQGRRPARSGRPRAPRPAARRDRFALPRPGPLPRLGPAQRAGLRRRDGPGPGRPQGALLEALAKATTRNFARLFPFEKTGSRC
ncbi:MAG: DUF885 domain-containing protein [Candidatus Moduliflexus flocculans]|nr:DUF885 domain-containing protein [Candidatus Moduliflexus flocculans]